MASAVTIYSPCDVVGIRVSYRDGQYISPVELTLLEAIGAGHSGTEQLAALLSLNERIVLNAVSDLWRRGYVVLDFGRGEVRLSEAAAAHAAAGTLDQLAGVERGGSVIKIMYDRLSGHVLPRRGLRRPRDFRLAVPSEGSGDSIEAASPAQILAAVQQSVGDSRDGAARHKEVVSAHLSPAELREPTRRMWLPIEVRVGFNDAGGRLRITVSSNALPLAQRQQAAERLCRLAEESPNDRFVQALRSQADPEYSDPAPLEELASRLALAAAEAASVRAGTRRQSHRRLGQQVAQVADELADRVASEVHAVSLYERAALREAARELVQNSHSQVVLVAPMLRLNGLDELLEPLKTARRRGVQIVVIWGRGQNENLDQNVCNALHQLGRRVPANGLSTDSSMPGGPIQVLWSARPARVNVCAVICDDRSALVTNDALFSSSGTGAPLQLGIRVEAPREGRCQPVEHLLDWASHVIPEYRLGCGVYTRYEHFHPASAAATAPGTVSAIIANPDLETDLIRAKVLAEIPDEPQEAEDDVAMAAATTWGLRWSQAAARIQEIIDSRTLPCARLVRDGGHIDLLWQALTGSADRLVIGTRHVDPAAVTSQMVEALRECAARQAEVTIVHDARSREDLGALANLSQDDQIKLSKRANGAHFLISDGRIAVGGFGYLSAGGGLSSARRRSRSDLSLLVTAPSLADQIVARFTTSSYPAIADTGPPVAAEPSEVSAVGEDVQGSAMRSAQRLLDRVRDAATQRGRFSAVRDALAEEADPWPVIGCLRGSGAPAEIIRVAVASSWDHPGADSDNCRAWLIQDLWRTGQFTEAAILRDGVPDERQRPRRVLTEVAATAGTAASAEALQTAALSSPSAAEAIAVAVVGAAELLLGPGSALEDRAGWDGAEIAEALRVGESQLPQPWRDWVREVRSFWDDGQRQLPIPAIQREVDASKGSLAAQQAWIALDEALQRGASVRFRADQGNKAHDLLFQADRPFGRLRAAATGRDAGMVRDWVADPALRDLSGLLDAATAEASFGAPLIGGPRRASMARLQAVVAAASHVAARVEPDADSRAPIPDAARFVVAALARIWPILTQAAGELPAPEVFLVSAALNRLAPVEQWGGGA